MRDVGILKQSLMVESLLELLTKRRSQTFYKPLNVCYVKIAIRENISWISIWNIVNSLVSFFFESVKNKLKERQLFSDQMNRKHFDLILAKRYCYCSIM